MSSDSSASDASSADAKPHSRRRGRTTNTIDDSLELQSKIDKVLSTPPIESMSPNFYSPQPMTNPLSNSNNNLNSSNSNPNSKQKKKGSSLSSSSTSIPEIKDHSQQKELTEEDELRIQKHLLFHSDTDLLKHVSKTPTSPSATAISNSSPTLSSSGQLRPHPKSKLKRTTSSGSISKLQTISRSPNTPNQTTTSPEIADEVHEDRKHNTYWHKIGKIGQAGKKLTSASRTAVRDSTRRVSSVFVGGKGDRDYHFNKDSFLLPENYETMEPYLQRETLNKFLSDESLYSDIFTELEARIGITEEEFLWISKPFIKHIWGDFDEKKDTPDTHYSEGGANVMIEYVDGYTRELGRPEALEYYRRIDKATNFRFMDEDKNKSWYTTFLLDEPHVHYISDPEDKTKDPIIISVESKRKGQNYNENDNDYNNISISSPTPVLSSSNTLSHNHNHSNHSSALTERSTLNTSNNNLPPPLTSSQSLGSNDMNLHAPSSPSKSSSSSSSHSSSSPDNSNNNINIRDSRDGSNSYSTEENIRKHLKVMVRHKKGTERILVPQSTRDKLRLIKQYFPELFPSSSSSSSSSHSSSSSSSSPSPSSSSSSTKFFKISPTSTSSQLLQLPSLPSLGSPSCSTSSSLRLVINKHLEQYEAKMVFNKYKFGVLYVKENQTNEDQWYNNKDGSELFNEFITLLGHKIRLLRFKGFRGGLDVKFDSTGTESIYRRYRDLEIMFHVSTLLPFYPKDEQQVERKRHLGNDIVIIVFREGRNLAAFNPMKIHSQFNHVFIVVDVDYERSEKENGTFYKVAVCRKSGVKEFGPFIPEPSSFKRGRKFREFILTKAVNGERASFYAPDFYGKMVQTRKNKMMEILDLCSRGEKGVGEGVLSSTGKKFGNVLNTLNPLG
eukprot:TRINITY_DN2875_c2_g1_i1.p1 TRINITY_DN2875_c2_g1~~TRINITY_DN2875_c2_g1_i1.p1  ORF type:complete len:896 (+),score=277.30 TRINITY_DN2875_c2_g1_i1:290-2977(+)